MFGMVLNNIRSVTIFIKRLMLILKVYLRMSL